MTFAAITWAQVAVHQPTPSRIQLLRVQLTHKHRPCLGTQQQSAWAVRRVQLRGGRHGECVRPVLGHCDHLSLQRDVRADTPASSDHPPGSSVLESSRHSASSTHSIPQSSQCLKCS